MSNPDCNCHSFLCTCNKTYGPLSKPTRPAPPMPEIKQPIPERRTLEPEIKPAKSGLRSKKLVDIIRMQEILKAMQIEMENQNDIPPLWTREFLDLVRDM